MDLSALIFVALAVAWAAYLVPKALRHHEDAAASRSVDGSDRMRVLARREPVSVMVVNALPEPTAVHWHGIEPESYYDGVAGFSGSGGRRSPAIAPRDSFEAP